VITFAFEHHANLLPWRRRNATVLPIPTSPEEMLHALDAALTTTAERPALVAMTGASNVTGEVWPIDRVAELVHSHAGRLFVDGAQLAAHRAIDKMSLDIDYLVMSGHKLYAPFGSGVLIGPRDWLGTSPPFLWGGGSVRLVTADDIIWADLPDRQEAGSPNVIGVAALGVACDVLASVGMDRIEAEEEDLIIYAEARLAEVPRLERYRLWDPWRQRLGIFTFNLRPYPYALLASILSAEYGIGVRHGCFCAHPLMSRLMCVSDSTMKRLRDEMLDGGHPALPGAVRASIGLATTRNDVDALAEALLDIAANGPRWRYRSVKGGGYDPDPDPRALPDLPFRLAPGPPDTQPDLA
jgi:selenocysteine lyase/cysteine desulfurase